MAHGKTLTLRYMEFASPAPRETRERDRSLPGKARRRARKASRTTKTD